MIIIQIILIGSFVYLLLRLLTNSNSYQMNAWIKILGILFTVLAIVIVLSPNSLNAIAHLVGVTRGADLLLYLLTLAFILTVLNLYIKGKHEQKRLVQLARKVAILEAELKHKS